MENLYSTFLQSTGVSTDTRSITRNCLFFALKGAHFNGNQFAQEAIDQGALLAVVDEEEYYVPNEKMILVKDVLETLQQLALFHRNQLKCTVIGLTGSNGKTTTKELVLAVLSQKFKTSATKGNLNNHIGVPLTLLSISTDTEIAIVEMGANHLKEIEFLSTLAKPDYGYITNFGKAHLEGFGSLKGVIKGKTELYHYLKANKGKAFVNDRNEIQVTETETMERILFGSEKSAYPVTLIVDEDQNIKVEFSGQQIPSHLSGHYNFDNISAAIAIGAYMGLSVQEITAGIESYVPSNFRSQIITKGKNTIIMDAYNANPTSMMAALENFKKRSSYNKIIILGDMFELGKETAKEHQAIVNFIETINATTYLVGAHFSKTVTTNPYIETFSDIEGLKRVLLQNKPSEATILIKGSRGMALERILDFL